MRWPCHSTRAPSPRGLCPCGLVGPLPCSCGPVGLCPWPRCLVASLPGGRLGPWPRCPAALWPRPREGIGTGTCRRPSWALRHHAPVPISYGSSTDSLRLAALALRRRHASLAAAWPRPREGIGTGTCRRPSKAHRRHAPVPISYGLSVTNAPPPPALSPVSRSGARRTPTVPPTLTCRSRRSTGISRRTGLASPARNCGCVARRHQREGGPDLAVAAQRAAAELTALALGATAHGSGSFAGGD